MNPQRTGVSPKHRKAADRVLDLELILIGSLRSVEMNLTGDQGISLKSVIQEARRALKNSNEAPCPARKLL
jgi:hypothetical protein